MNIPDWIPKTYQLISNAVNLLVKILIFLAGLAVATGGPLLAFELLYSRKLTGSEFIALTLGSICIGIAILLIDRLSEFSIAGSTLKFKEIKNEADEAINKLNKSKITTFKFMLRLLSRFPGGLSEGTSGKDSRINDFWILLKEMQENKIDKDLSADIVLTATTILQGQLKEIGALCSKVEDKIIAQKNNYRPSKIELIDDTNNTETLKADAERLQRSEFLLSENIKQAIEIYDSLLTEIDRYS